MIGADPDAFYFRQRYQARELFAPEALDDYLRCARRPGDDPRDVRGLPGRSDLRPALDEADRGSKRIACPLLVLWGGRGKLPELYDDVLGSGAGGRTTSGAMRSPAATSCAEEAPQETLAELLSSSKPGVWR